MLTQWELQSVATPTTSKILPMANWFYVNSSGEKVGPVTSAALKTLAQQGLITPETVVENDQGRSVAARRVNGLTFSESLMGPESVAVPLAKTSSAPPSEGQDVYGLSSPESPPVRPVAPSPFVPASSSSPFVNPAASSQSPFTQSPFTQPAPAPGSFCTYCGQPVHPMATACMVCGANPTKHRKFCGSCCAPINEVQVICTKCHTPVGGSHGNAGMHAYSAPKARLTYVLLAVILLGGYGIHNFYAGRKSQAIAQLIIGLVGAVSTAGIVTVGVWIWAIVEAIVVKEDGEGRPMV